MKPETPETLAAAERRLLQGGKAGPGAGGTYGKALPPQACFSGV